MYSAVQMDGTNLAKFLQGWIWLNLSTVSSFILHELINRFFIHSLHALSPPTQWQLWSWYEVTLGQNI